MSSQAEGEVAFVIEHLATVTKFTDNPCFVMDPFKLDLVDVAKDIGEEDLEVLKYFSEDVLTAKSIDGIYSTTDLFTKLQELLDDRGCKTFLRHVFSLTKNNKLRNKLGTGAEDGWPRRNELRILLYEISEELSEEEWKKFKFLLPDEINKRDKEKTRIAILSVLMKQSQKQSLVDFLEKTLKSLYRPDLLEKLDQHKNARREIIYTRSPEGRRSSNNDIESIQDVDAYPSVCSQHPTNKSGNAIDDNKGLGETSESDATQLERQPATPIPQLNQQPDPSQQSHNIVSDATQRERQPATPIPQLNQQPDPSQQSHNIVSDATQRERQPATPMPQLNQQPDPSQQSHNIVTVGRFSFYFGDKKGRILSADVYEGKMSNIGIAIKVFSNKEGTDDFLKQCLHECEILKELEQVNVQQHFLKYYGYETLGNTFCLGLELYRSTLNSYMTGELKKKFPLEKDKAKQNCRSLAKGVEFLHSKNIMHRGINPYNIFVIYEKEILFKIGNLGSCERIDSSNKVTGNGHNCLNYTAKEVLEELDRIKRKKCRKTLPAEKDLEKGDRARKVDYIGQLNFSFEADIFALGCVFYFILTEGHHPYRRTNLSNDRIILTGRKPVLKELNKFTDFHFIELIKSMISHRKEDRPTAARVYMYPAFMRDHVILSMYSEVSNKLDGNPPQIQKRKFEDHSILPGSSSNWLDYIPVKKLKSNLIESRHTRYDGEKVISLLRAIRNTKNHIWNWSNNVQSSIREFPGGVLAIWNLTCPKLLVHVHDTVRKLKWDEEEEFAFMKF